MGRQRTDRLDEYDERMRRAVAIPFAAGVAVILSLANLPLFSDGVRSSASNAVGLAGLLTTLLIWRFPWRRYHRNLFLVITFSATALIASLVYLNGGPDSPFDAYFYLVVIFAPLYYSRAVSLLVGVVVILAGLLPALYGTADLEFGQRHFVLGVGYLVTIWVQGLIVSEVTRRERARRGLQEDLSEVTRLRDELARANEQLALRATTDTLTGLPNHGALIARLDEELERARRFGHTLSALFFDIDHFKRINDTHGHQAGDAVLRQIGALAVDAVREVDTVGRYGGEEFVALLPETGIEQARNVAERLREAIAAHPFSLPGDGRLRLTVSLGVAACAGGECDREALLREADGALYRAKREGRDRVRVATGGHGPRPGRGAIGLL